MELEQPQVIHKSFSITSVVEKAIGQNDMAEGEDKFIEIKGYASRMLNSDGSYVIDSDLENIDTFGIDLSRLKNGILPLLFQHKQDKAVGKVTSATYDKDGLLITAKLFKFPDDELTNYVYYAVKTGVISSFSIGILVKDFEVINQDNEDYLQLSKSEAIEVSLVSVPANPEATFQMTAIKGVTNTLISKSVLKPENKEVCNSLECALQKNKVTEVTKGLDVIIKEVETAEVTAAENEVTATEKETVLGVTEEAMDKLEELQNIEDAAEVETEDKPEVGDTVGEVVDTVDTSNDKPETAVESPESEVVNMIDTNLETLSKIDIESISESDMEKIYETLSTIVDKIEERVVTEVAAALLVDTTIIPE